MFDEISGTMGASVMRSASARCQSGGARAWVGAASAWLISWWSAGLLQQPALTVPSEQLVWNRGCTVVRPLFPNQSGNQLPAAMSQVPGLLVCGVLPRSVKYAPPAGTDRPISVMPHFARLPCSDWNTVVAPLSLEWR